MPPYAFEVIASNIFAIIYNPQIYTTTQMCKKINAHIQTHSALSKCLSPTCVAVLRPCILMALMMLHAALGPLKVNSLTSVVSRLRLL